tara:strand:- start:10893 stop:11309 length:417 start_codon:yes stop_codon:yes gene_type:complete
VGLKLFKHKKDFDRYLNLHPVAFMLLAQMRLYCFEQSIPFKVTSTVSTKKEDESLDRVSSTHREGRAFDLSLRNWSEYEVINFKNKFEERYGHFGAINSNGEKRLIVDHTGTARHLHIQIDRSYTILEEIKTTFWEEP